jgi:hypothetical protein
MQANMGVAYRLQVEEREQDEEFHHRYWEQW